MGLDRRDRTLSLYFGVMDDVQKPLKCITH